MDRDASLLDCNAAMSKPNGPSISTVGVKKYWWWALTLQTASNQLPKNCVTSRNTLIVSSTAVWSSNLTHHGCFIRRSFVTSCTPRHCPLQPQHTTNLFAGPSVKYRCQSTSFYPINCKHLTDSCATCHPLPQIQKHKMPDQQQKYQLGNLTYWTFLAMSQQYINCVYKHFYYLQKQQSLHIEIAKM